MRKMFSGTRPDLTQAQAIGVLVAGVPVIANLLRAFGVFDATPEQEQVLRNALEWAAIVAGLLFVSDAGLRAARNAADAKRDAAAATSPAAATAPATPPVFGHNGADGFPGHATGAVPDVPGPSA
jgi:hypothetical protein